MSGECPRIKGAGKEAGGKAKEGWEETVAGRKGEPNKFHPPQSNAELTQL